MVESGYLMMVPLIHGLIRRILGIIYLGLLWQTMVGIKNSTKQFQKWLAFQLFFWGVLGCCLFGITKTVRKATRVQFSKLISCSFHN